MKISEYKGQDLEEMAKYHTLKSSLHQFRLALDFVVYYGKCLELQHNTNLHLHHLVSSVISKPTDQLECLMNSNSSELADISILNNVMKQAISGLEEYNRIKELKEDFKTKENDFILATNNLNLLLTNLKVASGQLHKIESQYDDIFYSYIQSRRTLKCEMTRVITRYVSRPYGNFSSKL